MDEAGATWTVITDDVVNDGLAGDEVADEDAFAFSSCAGTRTAMATTTAE